MTKAKISEYDAVAANNTDVNGVNIAEGCPPSGMNNMGREIMAALKRFQTGADGDSVTVGGSLVVSNTLTAGPVSATTLNTSGAVVFNDAGADVDFRVEGDTNANLLFVDASADKVGIGTSSPATLLNVSSATTNAARLRVTGTGSTGGNYRGYEFGSSGGFSGGIFQDESTSALSFWSSSGGSSVTIDSSGNVGIGTSSPAGKLHVSGTTTRPVIQATNTAGNADIKYQSTNRTYVVGVNTGSASGEFAIYDDTAGAERMRIDSSGNLLVGTTNTDPSGAAVQGIAARGDGLFEASKSNGYAGDFNRNTDGELIRIRRSGSVVGSISITTTATTYNTSSDYRLKENVAPMTGALAKVLELNPVTYTWKIDGSAGEGFIAHELQAVCPDAVSGEKDATDIQQVEVSPAVPATYDEEGNELTPAVEAVYEEREVPVYQGVDTSFLVATLTAAIQELSAKNDALEARIAALENA